MRESCFCSLQTACGDHFVDVSSDLQRLTGIFHSSLIQLQSSVMLLQYHSLAADDSEPFVSFCKINATFQTVIQQRII